MNLLREEFCKETNTPMGLDDVYNYVKWLENKWQQERSYSEEEVFKLLMEFSSRDINSSSGTPHSIAKWFEQFKKK